MISSAISLMSGCATMDSSLSCDQTAFDSCLTMKEADSMSSPSKHGSKRLTHNTTNNISTKTLKGQQIYLAPWKDAQGIAHSGGTLEFASKGRG